MFRRKFRPIYLLFFIIPLVYFFLFQKDNDNSPPDIDFLYFSAKSSKPATINLFSETELLSTWELNAEGYKYFDYSGNLKNKNGIFISINNLSENDTISFLSFNIFRDNQVSSLYNIVNPEEFSKNAEIVENDGVLKAIVKKTNEPVSISLKPSESWEKADPTGHFIFFIEFLFLITFILLNLFAPSVRYFIFTLIISLSVMFGASFIKPENTYQVEVKSRTSLFIVEFFYNHIPQFSQLKQISIISNDNVFNVYIDFKANRFVRFDVNFIPKVRDLQCSVKCGIFSTSWNLTETNPDKLVLNDLVLKDGVFYITGPDPFISLTSTYFIKDIIWLMLLKQNVFLFAALLLFVLLIPFHTRLSTYLLF
ncbi:MAG: hypothetical protein PHT69_13350 [Bacteroidales bacterium]|nr:hypothetical protein [Bacteroidales bacterium]